MIKKRFLCSVLTAALVLGGMMSCATDDDSSSNSSSVENQKSEEVEYPAAYYGTYTGDWSVGSFGTYAMTLIVAENTLYCTSDMMTVNYEYVSWVQDSDGNWVCCGSHAEDGVTLDSAATTVTFTTDGKVYFSVTAMASMADPAELTYSSDS
ncbi:hypothetical protein, partial [Treponema sp.]|uniref:hypothetical protein n=1 Tax=Treponema sp. TaxID=166 RepID=UPI0025D1CED7